MNKDNKSFSAFFNENFHSLDLYSKVIELVDFVMYNEIDGYYVSGTVEERMRKFKNKYNLTKYKLFKPISLLKS